MIVEVTGPALGDYFLQMLQWLHPLCLRKDSQKGRSDAGGADVDNALSAVAKMIKVAPQRVPIAQVR